MTLIELMVALAILSLCASLAFSNLGPWLGQSREAQTGAQFWRALAPAQLALSELATAAIDPNTRAINSDEARFSVYLTRLSADPVLIDLKIEPDGAGARLLLTTPALSQPSRLLEHAPPLRFVPDPDALILEGERNGVWRPIASAQFAANGPLTCVFDPIARTCR